LQHRRLKKCFSAGAPNFGGAKFFRRQTAPRGERVQNPKYCVDEKKTTLRRAGVL
jgi:hypothetical protein